MHWMNIQGVHQILCFFPRILESLPPFLRQHSAAIGCTQNYQPTGVTVHSHCFEGLLQRCRRGRGCSELWKKHNFFWTPCRDSLSLSFSLFLKIIKLISNSVLWERISALSCWNHKFCFSRVVQNNNEFQNRNFKWFNGKDKSSEQNFIFWMNGAGE